MTSLKQVMQNWSYLYKVTYQSRVGPLKWLEPNTEDEVKIAGKENKSLIIIPVAFVSEHVETLVELDIEYKHLADLSGVPQYFRVPALADSAEFIKSLAWLVEATKMYPNCSNSLGKQCPNEFGKCGFSERK